MILGVLITALSAPLAVLGGLLAWLRLRRPPDDRHLLDALDRILEADCAALQERRSADPLRFRTTEMVRIGGVSPGWGLRSGRAHVVRTVRAATQAGYRLRLRVFARASSGRTLVRCRDVEVRRR